jgi:thiopeptide-type bacteriocin biosynthesis protein
MTASCGSEAGLTLPADIDAARLREVLGKYYEPFVTAGLAALAHGEHNGRWLQFALTLRDGQLPAFHASLAGLADRLVREGDVTNFFFMRKPPGFRLRFETAPERQDALAGDIEAELAAWPALSRVARGRYEPEEHLFGGPTSMRYVHCLFTADSLAWLAYFGLAEPCPAWMFSLVMTRQVLNGLNIAGWEDLNVWERIRRQAHRVIPAGFEADKVSSVTETMRALWASPELLHETLGRPAAALADAHGPGLREVAGQWEAGCFATGESLIGPREAAAFATIFHWNRGRLSAVTQSLVAAALADRTARP